MNTLSLLVTSLFYIFNTTLQQYLVIDDDGLCCLSSAPVSVSMDYSESQGTYSVGNSLWTVKPTAGSSNLYTIGRLVDDANAVAFVYATSASKLGTTYAEPATNFRAGQWQIATEDFEQGQIALDQDATTYTPPTLCKTNHVTLHRTLVVGEWNSMCLPFALSASSVKAIWGEGAQVAEYTQFATDNVAIFATTSGDIRAGVPSLLFVEQKAANDLYTFDDISASAWADEPINVTHDGWCFTGSYAFIHPEVGAYAFGSGNKIYHVVSDKVNLRGFRSYFANTGNTLQRAAWSIGSSATGIKDIQAEGVSQTTIYHINGTAAPSGSLPRGIYIVNGKKIITQ